MSASSGDPRPQAAGADEGNKRPGQRDVEQGNLDTEKQRYSPNTQGGGPSDEENLNNEPDEYARLLKFIDLEEKKEKHRRNDGGDNGEDQEMRRLWYMPWKKVSVQGTKARKVPKSWLETNMTTGLSDSEIDDRRARFGYNELERWVDQSLIPQQKRLSSLHTVQGSILSSSLLGTFVARFFSVRADFSTPPLHFADAPPTVMELAVLLAAGLRDWIDFGVIVRSRPMNILSFTENGAIDWNSHAQRFCRLVSREAGGRYRRTAQSRHRHESHRTLLIPCDLAMPLLTCYAY